MLFLVLLTGLRYATFCHLSNLDPTDRRAAAAGDVPPIDSLNVWPLISGANKTSPRATMPLPIGHNCLVLVRGDDLCSRLAILVCGILSQCCWD